MTLRVKYRVVLSGGEVMVQVHDGLTIGDIRELVREQIRADQSYTPTTDWDVAWDQALLFEDRER